MNSWPYKVGVLCASSNCMAAEDMAYATELPLLSLVYVYNLKIYYVHGVL